MDLYTENLLSHPQVQSFCTQRPCTLEQFIKEKNLTSSVIKMSQVHGVHCEIVTAESPLLLPDCDALITAKKNILLSVKTADCLPILFYHPKGIIGAVHAGRRGTEQKIIQKVLGKAMDLFQLDTHFYLWFGPCICKLCYQIDRKNDLHYDLIGQNRLQIEEMFGREPIAITESKKCSSCHNELYFSYRKEGAQVGRSYSLIMLQ